MKGAREKEKKGGVSRFVQGLGRGRASASKRRKT
jgi:hypothetical protein